MEFGLIHILQLAGALVLFLYGMKLMSESLQKVAGQRMRNILRKMTKNHFTGIISGTLITALIQSSSASTVMFVSFVNAGLLTFFESISLLMGANIGTTITTWLISFLGYKIDISTIFLPLVAVSFPLIFSKKNHWRSWGEVIVGFSLLFLGIVFMKEIIPDIHDKPEILSFLSAYSIEGSGTILLFILVGFILTVIIQSSSATLALIIVMCGNGWIGFELGAAIVIGSNIGTSITVNIASLVGNRKARKSAFSHFMFNFTGAIITSLFFFSLIKLSNQITLLIEGESPLAKSSALPIGLSIFHTLFNLINVLILVWFIKPYTNFINWLFPDNRYQAGSGFKFISTGILSTSELSMIQVRKEVKNFADQSVKMFDLTKKLYATNNKNEIENIFNDLQLIEKQMDKTEVDIASYLSRLSEKDLSIIASRRIRSLLKISDNVESIADNCYNLGKIIKRKSDNRIWFTPELRSQVNEMFKHLDKAFEIMKSNFIAERDGHPPDIESAYMIESQINELRNQLKDSNLDNIKKKEYRYQAGVTFIDIISISENIGDHIINISESLNSNA